MQNLLQDLITLLEEDERLVVDRHLLKNKVIELALSMDPGLVRRLLAHDAIRRHFFVELDGVLVFDKVKFHQFVSNKAFLPDSYTTFRNKIGLMEGNVYLADGSNVVLAWPYKDCVLEGGQTTEDAQRDEVFWNETLAPDQIDRLLAPKALTGFKRYDATGQGQVNTLSVADNLIIKGNNLLALHTLKHTYGGQVDAIDIDPPFNPDSKSNTFCYNNSFNNSTWLTFIMNRLEVARFLLKPEGVLIVAIDDNEHAYLVVLLKELFPGHEVHSITIVHNPRGVQGTNFSYTHEYAVFVLPKGRKSVGDRRIPTSEVDWSHFRNWGGESLRTDARNCFYPVIVDGNAEIVGFGDVLDDDVHPQQTEQRDGLFYVYPIDNEGTERKWRYARQSVEAIRHLLRTRSVDRGYEIEIGKDFGLYKTVWQDPRYDANKYGTQLVKELVPGTKFDFPKSLYNIYDCLEAVVGDNKNALVLDFFAGSGTTGHAVLELNKADGGTRRFILCEQMHYVESVAVPRVHKVTQLNGAGSFVYCELANANEAFVERIQDAESAENLEAIWLEMQERAFLSYRVDAQAFDMTGESWAALGLDDQKRLLIEVLDKNMLFVPLSEVDDASYGISDEDKRLNRHFQGGGQETRITVL